MISSLGDTMLNSSLDDTSVKDNAIPQTTHSGHSHVQTVSQNSSVPDGCTEVIFSEMEYIPWDNPDNIVSAEVEMVTSTIKNNMLGLLFVIGAPANVINMAVFYKQGLRDRVNLCLFVLAFADLMYLTMEMLNHGEQLYIQFTTKERFGPVITFLFNNHFTGLVGFRYVSFFLSAIIACERCLCVLNPLKFQTLMSTGTMAAVIAVVNILVVGLFFIVVFRHRIGCIYDPVTGILLNTPVVGEFYRTHRKFINSLDSFVFGAGLPGVVMIVVITATTTTVVKLRKVVTWRAGTSSAISPREVALTKMLIGNSVFFIACVTPNALFRFGWLFIPEMDSGLRHHNFFQTTWWIIELCTFINSSLNIFIYYAMGSRYRETFWALCGKQLKAEKGKADKA